MVDKEKIKNLPLSPGVYIMRDKNGEIIYIGKALALKNRVSQYFNRSPKPAKVQAMVDHIADFEYIITLSESDALALESNLIHKYKPYYNILLKDDKADPYVKIDLKQTYPTLEITRKVKRDGARYFGPYFNGIRAGELVAVIRSVYGMRACPKKLKKQSRACLNYDIELCKGCCMGYISPEDYAVIVKDVMKFLSGYEDTAQRVVEEKMARCAQNEDFERAIVYRDQLEMLKKLRSRTIANVGAATNADTFAYASDGTYAVMSVAIVRASKMLGVKSYPIVSAQEEKKEIYSDFVAQYYEDAAVPEEVNFAEEFDGEALQTFLSNRNPKASIGFPQKGMRARLAEMARRNASDYLIKSIEKSKKEEAMTVQAARRLGEILGIPYPRRIECFDISNISGVDKVASDVCFIDGKAEKSEYRRFQIKTVQGADDFASMAETISRRLARIKSHGWATPDLIVIDGGKGQLSHALEAMRGEGFDIPMCSLAKKEEEVFVEGRDEPILIPRDDNVLKLLQRVRDESHRFAVLYHRATRAKKYTSELDKIPNVGEKTRRILLAAFPSVQAIREASLDELEAVSGVNKRVARSVYEYYKENKS